MAKLKVTLAGKSTRISLPETGTLVGGKDPENSLPLDATGASRRHFRIGRLKEGGFAIEDLGSTNGTIVNGKKIKRAKLSHGDVVQVTRPSWRASACTVDGMIIPIEKIKIAVLRYKRIRFISFNLPLLNLL